jgi:Protein of unknown function (DUF1116)
VDLAAEPRVITMGIDLLADALAAQTVEVWRIDWRPPLDGDALVRVLADRRRQAANEQALAAMLSAGAALVDVRPAGEALGLQPGQFLHAGPPISWDRASGPLRGALIGAMLLEGIVAGPAEAEATLSAGRVELEPCHHRGAVGPMAGVISPSMWLFELRDPVSGSMAWCPLNEGLGKVLRYGAYSADVIERLSWMNTVLGPALRAAVRRHGPVDVKSIIAQMVQMGDEGHNRNRAGTLLLLRELLPDLVETASAETLGAIVRFVAGNDHFFLNLVMPAGKLQTSAAAGIDGSSVVTTMARNGTDFGIQVSGLGGRWFTGPAQVPEGLFLGTYGPDDANPDIGDSAIAETMGLGGFVMASAPAIVQFVGGSVPDAIRTTRLMYEITVGENPAFALPILDFRGAPTGIDVVAVVKTGVLPQINTGMAGKVAGTGQVGAGLVTPPAECFVRALEALAETAPDPFVTG